MRCLRRNTYRDVQIGSKAKVSGKSMQGKTATDAQGLRTQTYPRKSVSKLLLRRLG